MSKRKGRMRFRKDAATKVEHVLVGSNVYYQSHIWRVTAAHQDNPETSPWLVLRRGLLEATAKPYEVVTAFD